MPHRRPTPVLLLAALLAAAPARAAPAAPAAAPAAPRATLDAPWLRILTPDIPAGGYFTLRNTGDTPLVLVGARSPACGALMLHQSTETGGMSDMHATGPLRIDAGRTLRFAPGGYHLMCMSPSPTLHPGGTAPVTLVFDGGATLTAPFAVHGARGP